MKKPKRADPFVWGAILSITVAVLMVVYGYFGYHPKLNSAGLGGIFFVGMFAAWVRNIPLR